jgi:iron transport multicopper oxidase
MVDRYHIDSITAVRNMLTPANTRFQPPIPDSLLVNDGQGAHINFTQGKTYRIRIINIAAFGAAMIHFDSHIMNIIMNDGQYIKKQEAYHLRVASAQRYDFLISAANRDSGNYPFLVSLDLNRDWTNFTEAMTWGHNYTGYLVMDPSQPLDKPDVVDRWQPVDDAHFQPYDDASAYSSYDKLIKLDFKFCFDQNGFPRSCFNNLTYINQEVPTLYSAATTGDANTDPIIYGQVNPFIVNYGDTVQIVLNNIDVASHPFHLHGHHFQVLDRPASGTGLWPGRDENYAATPPVRDTVSVMPNSYVVLRFRADNPGVWLFHCHIEWHVEMGLTATVIEAPDRLRNLTFPADHIEACKVSGTPYAGNAAGNTQNATDTTGFITVPPTVYIGCVAPFFGMVSPRLLFSRPFFLFSFFFLSVPPAEDQINPPNPNKRSCTVFTNTPFPTQRHVHTPKQRHARPVHQLETRKRVLRAWLGVGPLTVWHSPRALNHLLDKRQRSGRLYTPSLGLRTLKGTPLFLLAVDDSNTTRRKPKKKKEKKEKERKKGEK